MASVYSEKLPDYTPQAPARAARSAAQINATYGLDFDIEAEREAVRKEVLKTLPRGACYYTYEDKIFVSKDQDKDYNNSITRRNWWLKIIFSILGLIIGIIAVALLIHMATGP